MKTNEESNKNSVRSFFHAQLNNLMFGIGHIILPSAKSFLSGLEFNENQGRAIPLDNVKWTVLASEGSNEGSYVQVYLADGDVLHHVISLRSYIEDLKSLTPDVSMVKEFLVDISPKQALCA
jgi:hypothetical protein